ncbi:hypothetical protein ACQ4WX_40815 [Streptomyces lasalocidi]
MGEPVAFEVDGGPQGQEERVAVALQLGTLVESEGVLNGEGMQAEGAGDDLELIRGGGVQADPDEGAGCGA